MLFPDAVADIRHSGAHGIPGILLPIYTIIDMIETAENVWSDSCVCAMVDQSLVDDAPPAAGKTEEL